MGTRWYIALATRFRTLWWIAVLGLTALVLLAVLVPYYGSGMHAPAMPWGSFSYRSDELAAITSFRGTIWTSTLWQGLFWYIGCMGWCFWLPALYLVFVTIMTPAKPLSPRGKWVQWIGIGLCALVGILWVVAAVGFYGASLPD